MGRRRKNKRRSGWGGVVIAALFVAAAVMFLLPKVRGMYAIVTGSADEKNEEAVREYLGDYVEPDTRILFASSDSVYEEVQKAIENREKQICVIGEPAAAEGYVNDLAAGAVYDGGVFRTMPYSSFWMNTYVAYSGTFSAGLQRIVSRKLSRRCASGYSGASSGIWNRRGSAYIFSTDSS